MAEASQKLPCIGENSKQKHMKKKFNTTGSCVPGKHYMVDLEPKIAQIFAMVEEGEYLTIHRPRQYGKTTILSSLSQFLEKQDGYLPIKISFEGMGDDSFRNEKVFVEDFLSRMRRSLHAGNKADHARQLEEAKGNLERLSQLGEFLSDFLEGIGQKTVLMIDEVDQSGNNNLFVQFLGLLRQKYLLRQNGLETSLLFDFSRPQP